MRHQYQGRLRGAKGRAINRQPPLLRYAPLPASTVSSRVKRLGGAPSRGGSLKPIAEARVVLGERVEQHGGDELEPQGRIAHEL
jgi:hypothetical protein